LLVVQDAKIELIEMVKSAIECVDIWTCICRLASISISVVFVAPLNKNA
jgi:hypothetical protein